LREFTDLLLSSNSESMLKTQVFLNKSKRLSKTWHQQQLSFGNSSRSLCSQPQLNSTINSTCVNWPVFSRASFKLKKNL
jgi:hypothetical protein